MPIIIIPPPIIVYKEGNWLIQGSKNAKSVEKSGSPNNITEAREARTYSSDQLYNVCPNIPEIIAINKIIK